MLEDVAAALEVRDRVRCRAPRWTVARVPGCVGLRTRCARAVAAGVETVRLAPKGGRWRAHREPLRPRCGRGRVPRARGAQRARARARRRCARWLLVYERAASTPPTAIRDLAEGGAGAGAPSSRARPAWGRGAPEDAVPRRRAARTLVLDPLLGNLSVSVLVGQVRSTAVDLLRALGLRAR